MSTATLPTAKKVIINISAKCRAIGRSHSKQMTNPEPFRHTYHFDVALLEGVPKLHHKGIVDAVSELKIREAYTIDLIEKLHHSAKVKKQIGGVSWVVQVMEMTYVIDGDLFQLEPTAMTYQPSKKVTPMKRRCNGRLFTGCKHLVEDGGVNLSGFCTSCYQPGIEQRYTYYKELRDRQIDSREAAKEAGFEVTI